MSRAFGARAPDAGPSGPRPGLARKPYYGLPWPAVAAGLRLWGAASAAVVTVGLAVPGCDLA